MSRGSSAVLGMSHTHVAGPSVHTLEGYSRAMKPALPGPSVVDGMEEEVSDGCVVWMDENKCTWCIDVHGAYGPSGALSYLDGGDWVSSRGGDMSGCLYWEDEQDVCWCRDIHGSYGPAGAEYHSVDGEKWFSDVDAWLELGDEAAEYFSARAATDERRRCADQHARIGGTKKKKAWENDRKVMRMPLEPTEGPDVLVLTDRQKRESFYGQALREISAAEARMNADFDAIVQKHKHIVWPELPLRM